MWGWQEVVKALLMTDKSFSVFFFLSSSVRN